jgi:hypothetical protein
MSEKKTKYARSIPNVSPEWRTAYPFVFERRLKRADGTPIKNPSYEIVVLAPKTHADPMQCANYKILAGHCYDAARNLWPGSVDAAGQWVWPQGARWPILDGDVPYKQKAPLPGQPAKVVDPNAHAWRKGHWQVEASHFLEPGPRVAVLQNKQAVPIPSAVVAGQTMYKSGDYANVSIYGLAYEHEQGTFGVNICFDGVMFTRPGEAIGNGGGPKSADAMFGAIATMAPPTAGMAPVAAPPPAAPGPVAYAPPAPAAPAAYAPPSPPLAPAPPAMPPGPPLPAFPR